MLLTACSAPLGVPPVFDASQPVDLLSLPRDIFATGRPQHVYKPAGQRYSYAPSAVLHGGGVRVYTCQNRDTGVIRDFIHHILWDPASSTVSGSRYVFGPGSEGSWDSVHVCDPAIVVGRFAFAGRTYRYAMFYLGTDKWDVTHNQLGVAFSESLDDGGQWVRYPNPLVTHPPNNHWGVGQPSATSVDGRGRILLFYTEGSSRTVAYVRDIDISDMSAPNLGVEIALPISGLEATDGAVDLLNNFDAVYDPQRDRFFVTRPRRPLATDVPTYIASWQQLVSISAHSVRSGVGRWRAEGEISPALTGFPRHHNAGIVRTLTGTLPDSERITVIYTTSCAGAGCVVPEWTYQLWAVEGILPI